MSLFDLSTGDTAEAATEYKAPSGIKQPIPDGTQLVCQTISAMWTEPTQHSGSNILIELAVLQKGEYFGRIENHKLNFGSDKERARDTAARMLKTYDTLGKGIIAKAEAAGKDIDDAILAKALTGIELLATFSVWEIEGNDGKIRTGNYVTAIQKKPAAVARAQAAVEKEENDAIMQKAKEMSSPDYDFDDDIPF